MNALQIINKELRAVSTKARAEVSQRFFKTGPGEYGEGDVFVGATMGQQRAIAKKHKDLSLAEVQQLLDSEVHEERMIALVILVLQFSKAEEPQKRRIYDFYLKNTKRINNWDLVDTSAPHIVGEYIWNNYMQKNDYHQKSLQILVPLAKSDDLWERRISILSTFYFIRKGDVAETYELAKILLNDKEDLIHKAVGWMLREVGKSVGNDILKEFLDRYASIMPRTMLRYAIEKFSSNDRKRYLNNK